MEVFIIKHIDFDLTISNIGFNKSFLKANSRQKNLSSSTHYYFESGQAQIFSPYTEHLIELQSELRWPVFFENSEYFVDIDFKGIDISKEPRIITKLNEIENKFKFRANHSLLSGTINFGNNIGKSEIEFQYRKNNKLSKFKFGFEVFPTKLDYKEDYLKILKDIEDVYPNLVLDFLKKTYTNYSTKIGSSNDLIWWQIFGGIYKDFLLATKYIINKPHARLIREKRYLKADKIKRFSALQEDFFYLNKYHPDKLYETEIKENSIDTIENRFFKFALNEVTGKYLKLKEYITSRYSQNLTPQFRHELNSIEKNLKIYRSNPFLRNVGDFKGFRQESLLIQKGIGYNTIYKNWIILKRGISFLKGIHKIEQKNIAELYEIWCFLEVKNIVEEIIGFPPEEIDFAKIEIDDFVFNFEKGVRSRVLFVTREGDEIELFHDYQFSKSKKDELRSYTVNQRPDIVVRLTKNDLKEKYKFTYLYDAKYRLLSDDNHREADIPPDDAINQMHRYRDAIYYNQISKDTIYPKKEVIGGYILFPGNGEIEQIKKQDFYRSIKKVNIGAFPLKPNDQINKELLRNHFMQIINADTEDLLNGIVSQKEMNYENVNPNVLIGIVVNEKQMSYFNKDLSKMIYYTGKIKPSRFGYKDLKYFSPYIKGKGCKYYYEIDSYSLLPRNEIYSSYHPLYSEEGSERLVLKLKNRKEVNNGRFIKIQGGIRVYRYTLLVNLKRLENEKIIPIRVTQNKKTWQES